MKKNRKGGGRRDLFGSPKERSKRESGLGWVRFHRVWVERENKGCRGMGE